MTLTTTNVDDRYVGDGGTVLFNVTCQFRDSDELEVRIVTIATGVATLKLEGTHYAVSGGAGLNGQVDFTASAAPPTALEEVVIRRKTDPTQQVATSNQTVIPSADIEESADRARMATQDNLRDVGRAIVQPEGELGLDMTLPVVATRASKYLVFAADGTCTVASAGDESATTVLVAGSTTTRSQAIRWGEIRNVKDWGAVGDGAADDASEINACISVGTGIVFFPAGTYICEAKLVLKTGVTLVGEGPDVTILKLKTTINAPVVELENSAALFGTAAAPDATNCGIENLTIDGNRANQTPANANTAITSYTDALTVRNVYIKNASRGIWHEFGGTATDFPKVLFDHVAIVDSGREAIYVDDAVDFTFDNVWIANTSQETDATYHGIRVTGPAAGTFRNCSLVEQSATASLIGGLCDATGIVKFTDCKLDGGNTVLELDGARHMLSNVELDNPQGAAGSACLSALSAFEAHGLVLGAGSVADSKGIVFDDSGSGDLDGSMIDCYWTDTLDGVVDFDNCSATAAFTVRGRGTSSNAGSVNYVGVDGAADGTLPVPVPGTSGSMVIDLRQTGSKLFSLVSHSTRTFAAAATITALDDDAVIFLTGTTNVGTINGGRAGQMIVFHTASTSDFLGSGNIFTVAGGTITMTADDTITLVSDGAASWYQVSASVNA